MNIVLHGNTDYYSNQWFFKLNEQHGFTVKQLLVCLLFCLNTVYDSTKKQNWSPFMYVRLSMNTAI